MDGYELAFWIAVAVIAALIAGICWPGRKEHPDEITYRVYGTPGRGETRLHGHSGSCAGDASCEQREQVALRRIQETDGREALSSHVCRAECEDYGGHNWLGDNTDTVAYLRRNNEEQQ